MAAKELRTTEVGSDSPLRLSVAAQLAFPDGSMTASGLRREIDRGNLAFERIAGKVYTTLAYIKEMRMKCRENQKERGSTGANRGLDGQGSGSSSTERLSAAQAAASMIAQKLKSHSKPI
ncbi:excisionase [Sinorhizobium medicae]|uniref:excisionase n=1 Tax=Sinorhizobium medicae TaxID=110321 RepID=UPI001F1B6508|nr:excisionase [Sinorhizobium medicae]